MAHTFTAMFAHVIFSTKHREARLGPDVRPRLFPYMAGIVRNLGGIPVLINGVDRLRALRAKGGREMACAGSPGLAGCGWVRCDRSK